MCAAGYSMRVAGVGRVVEINPSENFFCCTEPLLEKYTVPISVNLCCQRQNKILIFGKAYGLSSILVHLHSV